MAFEFAKRRSIVAGDIAINNWASVSLKSSSPSRRSIGTK